MKSSRHIGFNQALLVGNSVAQNEEMTVGLVEL